MCCCQCCRHSVCLPWPRLSKSALHLVSGFSYSRGPNRIAGIPNPKYLFEIWNHTLTSLARVSLSRCSSVQSHLFSSPNGALTLKMPVPYPGPPPNLEGCTRTPSHNHFCSAVWAQITSLRSDDLVVPKLPACGCE